MVPASTEMTFKHYNPHTKVAAWKHVTTGGFKHDGHNCKSDHFVSWPMRLIPISRTEFLASRYSAFSSAAYS